MFKKQIENKKDELIQNLQSLIRIPSVSNPTNNPSMPFGEGAAKALEFMLNLGKSLDFRTKNLDGYCGYIEFGSGEKIFGILAHLDVVPEGENWTYPPFSATIDNGKIFGRGSIDDKGPAMASLYAMKVVMDYHTENNIPFTGRVRLILGLNEEKDWDCINYYKSHEEAPTIGFSPDADFPCIYAEKAIMSESIKMDLKNWLQTLENTSIQITELDCNNNAINVVPKIASCILKIDTNKISMDSLISNIQNIKSAKKIDNLEIDIYQINNEQLKLTSHGIQAHAAHPDLGINAISRLLILLNKIFKSYNISYPILEFFNNTIGTEYNGKSLGINCEDESGKLTLNVGTISIENNIFEIGCNLRVPVKTETSKIHQQIENIASQYTYIGKSQEQNSCKQPAITVETVKLQDALYISKDDPLVTTLCNIYNKVTNSNAEPIAIGGGTYARAFPNCISFGSNLPGNKDMCHQTDEFISIENLLLATQIYAEAIEVYMETGLLQT